MYSKEVLGLLRFGRHRYLFPSSFIFSSIWRKAIYSCPDFNDAAVQVSKSALIHERHANWAGATLLISVSVLLELFLYTHQLLVHCRLNIVLQQIRRLSNWIYMDNLVGGLAMLVMFTIHMPLGHIHRCV